MSKVANLSKLRQERTKEINLRNKERERMREREKAAREREARYSNGHLFTSLTVSGTTLCSACNKSITAKEALSCPTCNVTIHNRCRDALPHCTKMKQRQQKMVLMRNNSALQNVALRSRGPGMRERPTSAIYPSESFRHTLLGSRRGRANPALSKSVSTNNIVGALDDSPLGLRRILSQSTDSLIFRTRTMSVESLTDDGDIYYSSVLDEMKLDGPDFKADSWSMAVDSAYLQSHSKTVIKRQDVIYELIQTELHHMRTLHIMDKVFRYGMLEELQMEPGTVASMFPCLDQLMRIHSHFLGQLLLRCNSSLQGGAGRNFTIHTVGDILLEQFSGQWAEELLKTYADFCSRHLKAVKLYKELLAKDKRFQLFIRRLSRGPLLRCHGVQECILLVTQRISKYPVLIQHILENTTDDEELSSVAQALSRIRQLLSAIDQQMKELEETQRLQEIHSKVDSRSETRVRDGRLFKCGELLRRRLVHEGTLVWKTSGTRLKDALVLLMTDILVCLQEKDQKYIFPCLDKPPVFSIHNLIVRDIANHERGMFLITDTCPPEMYEFHAASKEDKNIWMRHIQQTVSNCPSREEFPLIESEHKAHVRRLKVELQQKDREMLELLQERVSLFCELAEVTSGQDLYPPVTRYMFRADTPQAPRAEKNLQDATAEVDRLSELLFGPNVDLPLLTRDKELLANGAYDLFAAKEIFQSLMNLSVYLHSLQAAVIKQDSILELLLQPHDAVTVAAAGGSLARLSWRDPQGAEVTAGSTIGELALLQRQHSLLQEELLRLRDAESRFRDSERARAKLERQVRQMKGCSGTTAACQQREEELLQLVSLQPESETSAKDGWLGAKRNFSPQTEGALEHSDLEVDMMSDAEDETASNSSKDLQDIQVEL